MRPSGRCVARDLWLSGNGGVFAPGAEDPDKVLRLEEARFVDPDTFLSSIRVEFFEKWRGHVLHYLRMLGGEVLPPSSRGGFAVELALSLLLLGDVLPGMFLDCTCQLILTERDLERRVEALHGTESIGPQFFVADQDPRSLVLLVGLLGFPRVPYVVLRPSPYPGIGFGVRERLPLPAAVRVVLVLPATLLARVEPRSDDVPGVSGEVDHTALGHRLREQGSSDGTVRLLYHYVPSIDRLRVAGARLAEHES